tara:strand:+ start:3850 stop:5538 length:1689 start_codon:yes stop_codon:yes gene_type:complete
MKHNHEVLSVTKYKQALTLARQMRFDLMFVDGVLPDGDGVSFIEEIRRLAQQPKIIFISASQKYFEYPLREHLTHTLSVDTLIKKPIDDEGLSRALSAYIPPPEDTFSHNITTTTSSIPLPQEGLLYAFQETGQTKMPLLHEATSIMTNPALSRHSTAVQASKLFEEMRQDHAQRLEKKLFHLLGSLSSFYKKRDRESLDEALQQTHQLHGSAGSFGFSEISEQCGVIEKILESHSQGQTENLQFNFQTIQKKLEECVLQLRQENNTSYSSMELPIESSPSLDIIEEIEGDESSQTPPTELLNAFLLSEESALYETLQPLAVRDTIELCQFGSSDEILTHPKLTSCDVLLIPFPKSTAQNYNQQPGTSSLPLYIMPATVQAAQRIRKGNKSIPILFFGESVELSKRVLAAHVARSYYIEENEMKDSFGALLRKVKGFYKEQPKLFLMSKDTEFARKLQTYFTEQNMEAMTAMSPMHLMHEMSNIRPDLLLIDFEIPTLNGIDLCRLLRSMPEWRDIPFFLLTKQPIESLTMSATKAGVDLLLDKDIHESNLLQHVISRLRLS